MRSKQQKGFIVNVNSGLVAGSADHGSMASSIRSKLNKKNDSKDKGISLEVPGSNEIANDFEGPSSRATKAQIKAKRNWKKNSKSLFLQESIDYEIPERSSLEEIQEEEREKTEEEEAMGRLKERNYSKALEKARKMNEASSALKDDYEDEILKKTQKKIHLNSPSKKQGGNSGTTGAFLKENDGKGKVEIVSSIDASESWQEIKEINSGTEFLKGLQIQPQSQRKSKEESETPEPKQKKFGVQDAKEGITSVVDIEMPSEKIAAMYRKQNERNLEEEGKKISEELNKETTQQDLESLSFMHDLDLRRSAFDAICYFKARGMIGAKAEKLIGRAKDKRNMTIDYTKGLNKEIQLDYRDETGRLLTPKEAFRYICYRFHGHKPSKNKVEARRRKQELQEKAGTSNSESRFSSFLQNQRAKSDQPFVDISKLIK